MHAVSIRCAPAQDCCVGLEECVPAQIRQFLVDTLERCAILSVNSVSCTRTPAGSRRPTHGGVCVMRAGKEKGENSSWCLCGACACAGRCGTDDDRGGLARVEEETEGFAMRVGLRQQVVHFDVTQLTITTLLHTPQQPYN